MIALAGICVLVGAALFVVSLVTGTVGPLYAAAAACVAALVVTAVAIIQHRRRSAASDPDAR